MASLYFSSRVSQSWATIPTFVLLKNSPRPPISVALGDHNHSVPRASRLISLTLRLRLNLPNVKEEKRLNLRFNTAPPLFSISIHSKWFSSGSRSFWSFKTGWWKPAECVVSLFFFSQDDEGLGRRMVLRKSIGAQTTVSSGGVLVKSWYSLYERRDNVCV